MQRYKLTVSYDGTHYAGWQWQENSPTIESALRQAFVKVFKCSYDNFYLVGASRTDSGVHAKGQVARLCTAIAITPKKLMSILNSALPADIMIIDSELADEHFHPQHAVVSKRYVYTIFTKRPLPTVQQYGWFFYYPFDVEILSKALALFVGTHDYRLFCKNDIEKNTVKKITQITIEPHPMYKDAYIINIDGPSFLRYMIRRIVGAVMYCAAKKILTLDMLKGALKNKIMLPLIPCAPAKGLCLDTIIYGPSKERIRSNE